MTRFKKLLLSLFPLLIFLFLLVIIEIGLHAFDISKQELPDLFDPGQKFVADDQMGFKLYTDRTNEKKQDIGPFPSDVLLVGCLGDSVTYGSGAQPHFSYPNYLEQMFKQNFKAGKVKLVNLGQPAYTSEQGKRLFLKTIQSTHFDVILVGYGFNDGQFGHVSDRQALTHSHWLKPFRFIIDKCRLIQLGSSLIRRYKAEEERMVRRVSLTQYKSNIREILETQKGSGGETILLNLEFGNNYSHRVLQDIAFENNLPYLDLPSIIQEKCYQEGQDLAEQRGMTLPMRVGSHSTIAQVYVPDCSAQDQIKLLFSHQLNFLDTFEERVCLDDGIYPDAQAHDCVWSTQVPCPVEQPFYYIFQKKVDDVFVSEFPRFDKPDNPLRNWHIRIYLPTRHDMQSFPLITYGQRRYKKEYIHPDQEGYILIAETIFPVLLEMLEQRSLSHEQSEPVFVKRTLKSGQGVE